MLEEIPGRKSSLLVPDVFPPSPEPAQAGFIYWAILSYNLGNSPSFASPTSLTSPRLRRKNVPLSPGSLPTLVFQLEPRFSKGGQGVSQKGDTAFPATPETLWAWAWKGLRGCVLPHPPCSQAGGAVFWVVAEPGRNQRLWPGSLTDCFLFLLRSFG